MGQFTGGGRGRGGGGDGVTSHAHRSSVTGFVCLFVTQVFRFWCLAICLGPLSIFVAFLSDSIPTASCFEWVELSQNLFKFGVAPLFLRTSVTNPLAPCALARSGAHVILMFACIVRTGGSCQKTEGVSECCTLHNP